MGFPSNICSFVRRDTPSHVSRPCVSVSRHWTFHCSLRNGELSRAPTFLSGWLVIRLVYLPGDDLFFPTPRPPICIQPMFPTGWCSSCRTYLVRPTDTLTLRSLDSTARRKKGQGSWPAPTWRHQAPRLVHSDVEQRHVVVLPPSNASPFSEQPASPSVVPVWSLYELS